jgi:hypothetical protein
LLLHYFIGVAETDLWLSGDSSVCCFRRGAHDAMATAIRCDVLIVIPKMQQNSTVMARCGPRFLKCAGFALTLIIGRDPL